MSTKNEEKANKWVKLLAAEIPERNEIEEKYREQATNQRCARIVTFVEKKPHESQKKRERERHTERNMSIRNCQLVLMIVIIVFNIKVSI